MGLGDWLIYAGCFAAGAVLAWALGKVQGEGIKNRPAPKGSGCTGALGPKAQSNLETWANTRAARGQRAERRYLQGSETGGEGDRQAGPPNLPNGFWTV